MNLILTMLIILCDIYYIKHSLLKYIKKYFSNKCFLHNIVISNAGIQDFMLILSDITGRSAFY